MSTRGDPGATSVTGIAGWWSTAQGSAEVGGELRLDHNHSDPLVLNVDTADRPHELRCSGWGRPAFPIDV
jgi:hypothetical protein